MIDEIRYPAWYDGPRSKRTEEQVMAELEARFACSTEIRRHATTPLAPPPADPEREQRRSKTIGRMNGAKPSPGFVLNGMEIRNENLRRERRKREAMPAQIDPEECRHDAGWWRDGQYKSGGKVTGLMRLACRRCGYRARVTIEEADRMMGAREVTAA